MSAHTPGPWEVHAEYMPAQIWGKCSGASKYEAGTDCAVAIVRSWDGEPAKAEVAANARIIAAAPELLAELKALLEDHQRIEPHHEDMCQICRRTVAAIAKATGGVE